MLRSLLLALSFSLPVLAVPNVIVIVADDLSWHDLGCMGATDVKTPYIDTLATSGVKFLQAYSTAPVCSPSRAGLITGRYQQRFGQETNPGPTLEDSTSFGLPLTEATMGNRFKQFGYATGWIGKSHLGGTPAYHPLSRGFDEFFGFLRSHHDYWNPAPLPGQDEPVDPILNNHTPVYDLPYLTVALGERCVQFIEDHKTQPFFLFAPFSAVHFDEHLLLPSPQEYHDRVADVSPPPAVPPPPPAVTRHDVSAALAALDDAVGAILAKLQQRGLMENTLIFFTSDNGGDPNFGSNNGGLKGGKTEVYEGGIRVPLLMKWGTRFAGTVKTEPVSLLDILPTAIAATGNIVPDAWQLDGVNLLPWLSGQATAPSRPLFWRVETDGVPPAGDAKDGLRAMRQGNWKLVKPSVTSSWELYDLSLNADPAEAVNVASTHASLVQQMLADYDEWDAQLARPRYAWNNLNYTALEFVLEDIAAPTAAPYVEPPTSFSFQCPELNNETCYAVNTNHSVISLYRNSLAPLATLSVPARYLYSVKARVFNGVTYFSCLAIENDNPLSPGATEMWLLGLGPDANHRLARRVDEAGGTNHHEPDTMIVGDELIFTYSRGTQARRARTGIKLSDYSGTPTGFASLPFTEDFHAHAATTMRGTETTHLVAHENMLFAGQASTGAPDDAQFTGAQILRQESAAGGWILERAMPDHLGVATLDELTLGTDKLLIASFTDKVNVLNGIVGVRTRVAENDWRHSTIPSIAGGVPTSLGSRGNMLFAGISRGEIHQGDYMPANTQKFVWNDATPELSGTGPVLGFATADSHLYAACGLSTAGVGGLYQRNDATQAWTLVYRWLSQQSLTSVPQEQRVMRGLTTVRDPRGTTGQVLLTARSWPGVIERIDPARGHAVTVELDVRDFFARRWNDDSVRTAGVMIGYNAFTPLRNPVTGEVVHLIPLWLDSDAHLLIRHLDGTYEAADVGEGLRATRCIALSPFGEDAIYVGGFDNSVAPGMNTAWIMRGEWAAWPQVSLSRPNPPLMQLTWPITGPGWSVEATSDLGTWLPMGGLPTSSLTTTTQSIDLGTASRGFFRLRRAGP